jgi:cob(I)alamin adenosyltransferase
MTPEPDQSEDARHAAKMAKIKVARDKIMATKQGEKGLIIVHTGAGKGKSSSGFGMILRCIAHGMPSAVVQFIKGAWDTGERRLIEGHFSQLCQFYAMGEGFTWETQDRARDIAAARAGWEKAKELIRNPDIRLVLLDEINIALRYDYLDIRGFDRPQRQGRADRNRRPRHRDDAGQASVPVRHQGPAGRRVLIPCAR